MAAARTLRISKLQDCLTHWRGGRFVSARLAGRHSRQRRFAAWTTGLAVVVCALGLAAAPGFAVTVTTTSQPLPGSQFQGGDGDQDEPSPFIDWQGLAADGRVTHVSDPQSPDNVFAGGSKELDPGDWGLTTQNGGSTPASGNILDFYSAFDQAPEGDAFVYLAFTRENSNGDVFVTLAQQGPAAVDELGRRADSVPHDRRHPDPVR
jgi:hypothetical protein